MDERLKGSRPHAAKHERKSAPLKVDSSETKVIFGYPVLEAAMGVSSVLAPHYNAGNLDVRGSLDPEWKLSKLGDAKSLEQELSWLAMGCAEAGRCYGKTGDKKVLDALEELLAAVSGRSKTWGPDQVAVLTIETKGRGRSA